MNKEEELAVIRATNNGIKECDPAQPSQQNTPLELGADGLPVKEDVNHG